MNHEVATSERDGGLESVLTLVREYAGASEPTWVPPGEGADLEPLRLLVSTKLSLVAVVDHQRLRKQVRKRVPGDDREDVTTELDQIARRLRFAILDADTAQVLVLILVVHCEEDLRSVASDVFGPGGSKGDVVVRVVNASDEGALPLDLEIVRASLTTGQLSVGARPAAAFAGAAGTTLERAVEKEAEDVREWARQPIGLIENAFRSDEAETKPEETTERLGRELLSLLNGLAPQTDEEEARQTR